MKLYMLKMTRLAGTTAYRAAGVYDKHWSVKPRGLARGYKAAIR